MTPRAELALGRETRDAPRGAWRLNDLRWPLLGAIALAPALAPVLGPSGTALAEAGAGSSPALLSALAVWLLSVAGVALLWSAMRLRDLDRTRKELAARLQDAKAFAETLDACAVIVRDLSGGVLRWSAGCEHLFGYAPEEVRGRLVQEILVTRYPIGGRRKAQEALLRDGEWHGKLRHRRRDGSQVSVAAHCILQRNPASGDPVAVLEVHTEATSLEAAEAELRAGEARLRLAQEVAAIGTWEWDPEEDLFVFSAEHGMLFGPAAPEGAPCSLNAFLAMVHPEDREAVRMAFAQALESGEYEVEFRVPKRPLGSDAEDEVRWMIGRGRRMPGPVGRVGPILGVHVDITARKEAEQRQALLMREVDHRAKNALAVVQAFLRLTRADSAAAFARAVEDRIMALARTHTLLAEQSWSGVELRSLLASELAPFVDAGGTDRVRLDGLPVILSPVMVQPLSIALHELATNAAKYGALSSPEGRLEIAWDVVRSERVLRIRWSEEGGPTIDGLPERRGFGSRVIEQTVRRQLGGTSTLQWRPEGLLFQAEIPLLRGDGPPGLGRLQAGMANAANGASLSALRSDYPRRSTA